ncbi:MAG: PEP-CTERM sorting domain-containing protein [Thalassotalea sp.]|nr:PEP-CTERM sorting domain-containing protein [Thalassotalea sp.]
MKNKFLKGLVASFALAISGFASAGLITFDELSNGTALSDQYILEGVLFSGIENGIVYAPEVRSQYSTVVPNSPFNYLTNFYLPNNATDRLDSIVIDFLGKADNVSLFINTAGTNIVNFDVYDSSDVLVTTIGLSGSGTSNVFHNIGSDIGKLVAHQPEDSWWWALDDLSYNLTPTDVPEPSTLVVFALGLIGIASRKFKKQA